MPREQRTMQERRRSDENHTRKVLKQHRTASKQEGFGEKNRGRRCIAMPEQQADQRDERHLRRPKQQIRSEHQSYPTTPTHLEQRRNKRAPANLINCATAIGTSCNHSRRREQLSSTVHASEDFARRGKAIPKKESQRVVRRGSGIPVVFMRSARSLLIQ